MTMTSIVILSIVFFPFAVLATWALLTGIAIAIVGPWAALIMSIKDAIQGYGWDYSGAFDDWIDIVFWYA